MSAPDRAVTPQLPLSGLRISQIPRPDAKTSTGAGEVGIVPGRNAVPTSPAQSRNQRGLLTRRDCRYPSGKPLVEHWTLDTTGVPGPTVRP